MSEQQANEARIVFSHTRRGRVVRPVQNTCREVNRTVRNGKVGRAMGGRKVV